MEKRSYGINFLGVEKINSFSIWDGRVDGELSSKFSSSDSFFLKILITLKLELLSF